MEKERIKVNINHILVSIIIPVHQVEPHLFKCLDCLRSQTEEKIEIIIVDDHSDDDIQSAICQYLSDPRCRYYRLDCRMGPGGARNKGINVSHGEYIGFCDSDDWVDLDFYRKACDFLSTTQADFAMCGLTRDCDTLLTSNPIKCKYEIPVILTGEMAFQIMTQNYSVGIDVIPHCTNKVYRKSFLQSSGVRFQNEVFFQDAIFSVETMLEANKVICVPDVYYHYYRRTNSIIQSFNEKHIKDFENLGRRIKTYLHRRCLYEKYQKNYCKLIIRYYRLLLQEIFTFVTDEELRKNAIIATFHVLKKAINLEEYMKQLSAEQLYRLLLHEDDSFTIN